jgi:hypothetical protein
MTPYFGNECPERGAGLSHVVQGRMPTACLFCGTVVGATPPSESMPRTATQAKVWPTVFDHRYTPSLKGTCLRQGCGLTGDAHAPMKANAEEGECPVDHRGLRPGSKCAICSDIVEPALATGSAAGDEDGPGRLPWTDKQIERLEKMRAGVAAGYWKS